MAVLAVKTTLSGANMAHAEATMTNLAEKIGGKIRSFVRPFGGNFGGKFELFA